MKSEILDFNKKLVWRHRIAALVIAAVIFMFKKDLAQSFFYTSVVFNLYLVMLVYGFLPPNLSLEKGANTNPLKPLPVIVSGIRAMLIAALLALLFLKLKLSITGIILGFLLYKIVLLVSGLLNAKNHKDRYDAHNN